MMQSLRVAIFLAAKSIMRGNVGITFLTIFMLILANLNLLFVPSLVNGIIHSANDKLINTYSANIVVEAKIENPNINNIRDLTSQIDKIDGVEAATYRNSTGVVLSAGDERTNCFLRSIPPDRDKQVFQVASSMYEGQYLSVGDTDQILLGIQLAGAGRTNLELYSSSLKQVHAGDWITITYPGGLKKQYQVKGIFYSEFIQTDLQAFVTEKEYNSIFPQSQDQASVINIKIRDDKDAPQIINEISHLRDNLKFSTWRDMAGLVLSMTNSFDIINSILALVNLLIAGITVFIVTYVDLTNKRKQIGIERAIGITHSAISLSYVLRALGYAVLGSILSYLLYTYAVVPLEAGHPFHFPFGDVSLFISLQQIIRSAIFITLVAVIAAFLPVWQTIRIKLLDAIWG